MKSQLAVLTCASLVSFLPPAAAGERNHFLVNLRVGLNLCAGFETSADALNTGSPGPATGTQVDRLYEDGYVRVDASGNAGGQTWFWSYENASQLAGDIMGFTSRSVAHLPSSPDDAGASAGVELVYRRDLRIGEGWRWGVQGAVSYLPLKFESQATAADVLLVTRDSFSTFGSYVPQAPYYGTYAGPGVLLGAEPTSRSIFSSPASISLHRALEVDQIGIRLGPYLQWEGGKRFSAGLGVGISVAPTWLDFEYRDQAVSAASSEPALLSEGGKSTSEVLVGGYVEVMLGYRLSERWFLETAIQYQYLNELSTVIDGRRVNLESDAAVFLSFGLGCSF